MPIKSVLRYHMFTFCIMFFTLSYMAVTEYKLNLDSRFAEER